MKEILNMLQISVGKEQREVGIYISESDLISIEYDTNYYSCGDDPTDYTSYITAKDLFEIIKNLPKWTIHHCNAASKDKIKRLIEENEELKKEAIDKNSKIARLKSAIKVIKEG